MTLKLGNITTIVISSPQLAKEVLHKNDLISSYRAVPDTLRALDHNLYSVGWMQPSNEWRILRRICATKVFSSQQLDSTQVLRQKKVEELMDFVKKRSEKGEALDIGEVAFITVLLVAGVETTSITIEWVMAELLRNPEKLEKVRNELQHVIGKNEQLEEKHISKLPFLKAVVKETFRLHPPAPLLVPHKSQENVELCGFIVPKNAQVWVNVWAMGRDSSIWTNPNEFMPERFLESEIDFQGHDFELIPFGAGKRMCPGLPLAYRAVHILLASLLHCYDWKLPNEDKEEELDMSENFGLTLRKAQSLKAIPIQS
ncbi:hypothetical protein AHAS_Ahas12G0222200 [Arachis hypogaea]